jgi:predicted sugar kinase
LDDTLLEKVERLVDVSRQPLRWTSSTTVVIAQLVERIEALEAALREIADTVSAPGATAAGYTATERRSSDRLSESIPGSRRQ